MTQNNKQTNNNIILNFLTNTIPTCTKNILYSIFSCLIQSLLTCLYCGCNCLLICTTMRSGKKKQPAVFHSTHSPDETLDEEAKENEQTQSTAPTTTPERIKEESNITFYIYLMIFLMVFLAAAIVGSFSLAYHLHEIGMATIPGMSHQNRMQLPAYPVQDAICSVAPPVG